MNGRRQRIAVKHCARSHDAPGLAFMRLFIRPALAAATIALAASHRAPAQPRFEVTFSRAAHAAPITGRVSVALSRSNDAQRPPIQQTGETGTPLFGVNVTDAAPDQAIVLDAAAFGYPVRSLRDIPRGEYWVQPFVNVYTKFSRADGHTVWLHMDQWEGQHWQRSPGNLYGDPVKVTFDPSSRSPIRLVADKVVPRIALPADNDYVKRIKIQSQILTTWWGQPIFLGATILLPKDYDRHPEAKYPVVYSHGHFGLGAPGGFSQGAPAGRGGRGGGGRGANFTDYWLADGTPRMILVTLQHPSPYYDDSYGVNSENNGPYGDVILQRSERNT